MIEAAYLIRDGLCLYTKTFDPDVPDYSLISGIIKAIFDFGKETINKILTAIKFEDPAENFVSYLLLEQRESVLLALLIRLKQEFTDKEEKKIRGTMKEFLGEFENRILMASGEVGCTCR